MAPSFGATSTKEGTSADRPTRLDTTGTMSSTGIALRPILQGGAVAIATPVLGIAEDSLAI